MANNELNSLEHYGVQGMKWGRRKSPSKTAVQAKADHKQLSKMKNHGNTKAKRELKTNIAERSVNKKYASEFQRNVEKKAKADKAVKNIKKAAFYGGLYVALFGVPNVSKGKSYVNTNPGLMNVKVKKGVYNITNLK